MQGLHPSMGIVILPFAFVVVVVGGLGSLPGAILGASWSASCSRS